MKDYCTMFPDGIPFTRISWADCCKRHDDDYDAHDMTFEEANDYLYHCIKNKGEELEMRFLFGCLADVMWYGVSIFGKYFWAASDV